MLRAPVSVQAYACAYDFIKGWWNLSTPLGEANNERLEAFNKVFPVDPILDPVEEGEEPELQFRVERHTDDLGDVAVIALVLNAMPDEYLLDVRSNAAESMFVITKLAKL